MTSGPAKSRIWRWTAPGPAPRTDLALIEALTASGEALSRSQLKKFFEAGRVQADGKPLKASQSLTGGERIEIEILAPVPLDLIPEDRELEILFEDEHLIVINKPQGLTVHPSPTQTTGTLVHALLHRVSHLSGIGGVLRPGIVHRIDKNTSGALVVTKTDRAHQGLAETFAKHAIERTYWALCYGAPKTSARTRVQSLIGRNPVDRTRMSMKVKEGRTAVTFYERKELFGSPPFASFVEATLETGRTHQIRVHLCGEGFSVLGDPLYGTPTSAQTKWKALPAQIRAQVAELPGQALHARVLGFVHPITGEKLRWEATPPPSFLNLLATLRKLGS